MLSGPVEVIVVNFNAGEALIRCIQSVLAQTEPATVTVIDNASSDGSADLVAERFGGLDEVRLIRNDGNPGFATAVNLAVGNQPRTYLLILNPDCELRQGALESLRQALDGEPMAGLAGPMVTGPDGRPARGTLRCFPDPWRSFLSVTGLWRLGRHSAAFQGVEKSAAESVCVEVAEAVSGACMLVRKSMFRDLNGMDEQYGLHCEDLDLMYRLRQGGAHCLLVPAARVYHGQGVSSRSRPLWAHWQKHRGMQRFFNKFQAANYVFPIPWLVRAGIWIRFILTAPIALMRR